MDNNKIVVLSLTFICRLKLHGNLRRKYRVSGQYSLMEDQLDAARLDSAGKLPLHPQLKKLLMGNCHHVKLLAVFGKVVQLRRL